MSDSISFALTGVDELINTLKAVTHETKHKGGRAALRKAARVVAASAQRGALALDDPQTAKSIAKNIDVRWSRKDFRRTGNMVFRVGVLGGAKQYASTKDNVRKGRAGKSYKTGGSKDNPGGDTFYWRFLELGTEKSGAQPFLRPALTNNVDLATSTFISEYEKALDRAIRRAAKKGTPV